MGVSRQADERPALVQKREGEAQMKAAAKNPGQETKSWELRLYVRVRRRSLWLPSTISRSSARNI
jgi:hypothetical protein